MAHWFDDHRSRDLFEKPYLDKATSYLKPGAKILDVGCGMGEPIAQYLISRGFQVTGIDGSQKQIELAKKKCPKGTFFVADMRALNLKEKFDCVIVWHSLFHLSSEDQQSMFQIFEDHLNPQGMLLFTSNSDVGEIWSDNGGEDLYHASLSLEEYRKLLEDHHFTIIVHTVEDKDCGDATVWLVRYR